MSTRLVYSASSLLNLRNSQGISPSLRSELKSIGIIKQKRNFQNRHFYPKKKISSPVSSTKFTSNPRRSSTLPTLLVCNCRSIINKFDDFEMTLLSQKPDFALISETWLSSNIPDLSTNVDGYHCIRKDRIGRPGGGVALYFKKNLHVTRIPTIEDDNCESIWIEHVFADPILGFGKCIVCSLYHPPNADRRFLADHLQHGLETVYSSNSTPLIFIGGDFNRASFPALKSLKQIVLKPTRGDVTLDCIYTNLDCVYNNDCITILPPIGNSDHNTIYVESMNHVSHSMFEKRTVELRHRTPSNEWSFGCYLSHINWYYLLNLADAQIFSDIFYDVFNFGFDAFVPTKMYTFYRFSKPWFNARLKDIHSSKRKAFHSPSKVFRGLHFSEWNRRFKVEVDTAKKTYLAKSCNTPKDFWRAVGSLMGIPKTQTFPSYLIDDAIRSYSTDNLAEAFSSLFQSKWTDNHDILIDQHQGAPHLTPSLSDAATFKLLNDMPTKATCGPDGIPSWVLKKYAFLLSLPVSALFNRTLMTADIPNQWRVQRVSPIPKVSKPKLLKDYRPIAVSSSLGKSLERFVKSSLLEHLGRSFDKSQFGFRRGSSCTVALISTIHQWLLSLEKSKDIHALFLDFSAAFDSIPHSVILQKMQNLAVPDWLLAFTKAFLTNRTQFVQTDDIKSTSKYVQSGVPQGSILSPTLFAIAVHDFPVGDGISICKYADDMTLWSDATDAATNFSDFCETVVSWCDKNSLKLNASKSAEMYISLGLPKAREPLVILNQVVPLVKQVKFLGVLIRDNLTWGPNIEHLVNKASQSLFLLRRFRSFGADEQHLQRVYNAFFLPCVEYGSPVWDGGITQFDSNRLESLNRRARMICGFPNEVTLQERRTKLRLSLFNKALSDPYHLIHPLIPRPIQHTRRTRLASSGALEVPRARLVRFRKSFILNTTLDYNTSLQCRV